MRALVLALLLVASPLGASSRRVRIDSARYSDAWARVQACSGKAPLAGHGLSHLVVFSEPSVSLDGHPIYALWVPGDTVFIDASVSDTGWVMRHELLHALLGGPSPENGGPHPLNPFAWPCKLLELQNVPGGLMGAHR